MRSLHYPDLVAPQGWTYFRTGAQIRLIPPGTRADTATAAIIVSPLVGRSPRIPPPDQLMLEALAAEEKVSFTVEARSGPEPFHADTGLEGHVLEVTGHQRPAGATERRIYVMLADETCYYGVSFLASDAGYGEHAATFGAVARSVRPFHGRVVQPAPPAPVYDE